MKKYLIVLCSLLLVGLTACTADNGNKKEETNPFKGTTWVWTEDPVTWSFTFSEKEVVFDYANTAAGSTEQYKSTYTYTANTVTFNMTVWSGIVWKFKGTVTGNSMHLVDSGTEKIDIIATKK